MLNQICFWPQEIIWPHTHTRARARALARLNDSNKCCNELGGSRLWSV